MKHLRELIFERLKIDKNKKIDNTFSFDPVTNTEKFWGYNWILSTEYYEMCPTLLEWALKKCLLTKNEERFINDFLDDLEKNISKYITKKSEVLNGPRNNGDYKRPKCIYDICKLLIKTKLADTMVDKNTKRSLTYDINHLVEFLDELTDGKINKLDWEH